IEPASIRAAKSRFISGSLLSFLPGFANAYGNWTNAGCTSWADEKFLVDAVYSLRACVQMELLRRSDRLKRFRNVLMGQERGVRRPARYHPRAPRLRRRCSRVRGAVRPVLPVGVFHRAAGA